MKIFKTLKAWALRIRECTLIVYFIARDRRTPISVRLLAASVAAYALSPIDLIPDFIPILGLVDDLLIIPLGLALVLRLTPRLIETDARARAKNAASRSSHVGAAVIVALWVSIAAAVLVSVIK